MGLKFSSTSVVRVNVEQSKVITLSPSSNGVLLELSVFVFPWARDLPSGLTQPGLLEFYVHDSAGKEILGTNNAGGQRIVMGTRTPTWSWAHPDWEDILSAADLFRHWGLPVNNADVPGTYNSSMTMNLRASAGQTADHSVAIRTLYLEYDD